MKWEQVRAAHPDQWLIIEVMSARHEGGKRIIDDVQEWGGCDDVLSPPPSALTEPRDALCSYQPAQPRIRGAQVGGSEDGVVKIVLMDGLPFVSVVVEYRGRSVELESALLDTGSATTIMSVDVLGLVPEPGDPIRCLMGVGGVEYVFARKVDNISVDAVSTGRVEVELGGLDYGFEMNGILGMDFFLGTGAVIDLQSLNIDLGGH
jgi:hypothetical protein